MATRLAPIVAAQSSLGTDVKMDVPHVTAHGDADAFCRVIQNLLLNARTYAAGTPVHLVARQHGNIVRVAVSDGGPGIARHERSSVFERGGRGSASVGTAGDGLGLYISARFMTAMGGTVRVADQPGPGARIVVELPATSAAMGAIAPLASKGAGRSPLSPVARMP